MLSSDKSIVAFEKTVGVKHYSEFKYFQKHIFKKYGKRKAEEIFEVINARALGDLVNIYPLLHESLDLSIDFLSLQAGLHKGYLRWFLQKDFRQRDVIVDVACGNGYLPCFYAKEFPQSEVLGIDSCQEAVACAKELAQRLNLQNIRFEVMDVTSVEKNLLPARIDLLTAITAFNDILEQPSVLYTPPYLNSALSSRQLLQNI
jgi:2-polyprenyl-3-methyl-5-hydroxy-6-metoxy-1,4-benzoquinol methylase